MTTTAPEHEPTPEEPDTDEPEDPGDDNFAMKVERQVRKALGGLIGKGEVKVEEGGKAGSSEPTGSDMGGTPPSPKVEEQSAEESVRQALQKITAEDEHAKEHARIRESERTPAVVSRLTRAIWGDPD